MRLTGLGDFDCTGDTTRSVFDGFSLIVLKIGITLEAVIGDVDPLELVPELDDGAV
jgi:hypothetical protein